MPSATEARTTRAHSSRAAPRSACAASASSTWPAATSRSATRTALWIVFNGEIYNYRRAARELAARGHRFRTRSDTEVSSTSTRTRASAASSGCAACSPSPSGTAPPAAARWPATASARSRCSTPAPAGGSRSPPRSRRCWRTIRRWPRSRPRALDQYLTLRFVQPPRHVLRAHPQAARRPYMIWETGRRPGSSATGTSTYGPKWT